MTQSRHDTRGFYPFSLRPPALIASHLECETMGAYVKAYVGFYSLPTLSPFAHILSPGCIILHSEQRRAPLLLQNRDDRGVSFYANPVLRPELFATAAAPSSQSRAHGASSPCPHQPLLLPMCLPSNSSLGSTIAHLHLVALLPLACAAPHVALCSSLVSHCPPPSCRIVPLSILMSCRIGASLTHTRECVTKGVIS